MNTYSECAANPTALRLLQARATVLGIEHAAEWRGLPDETPGPDMYWPKKVLSILWPEHDPSCTCLASRDVVEHYDQSWLKEWQDIYYEAVEAAEWAKPW